MLHKRARMKELAKKAARAAKPHARSYLNKHGDKIGAKAKKMLGGATDKLVDKGADKIGIGRSSKLRKTAKGLARKGVNKGVDTGMKYAKKKLE